MNDLEQNFIVGYVNDQKAVERRIYEQSEIDTLKVQDGCVHLTPRGQSFLKFSDLIKKIYAIDQK